jgi:hypothetical protein
MAGKEAQQPGFIEKTSFTLRNAEIAVAAIAAFFSSYGVAALAAIGAVVDHATGEYFKQRRVQGANV